MIPHSIRRPANRGVSRLTPTLARALTVVSHRDALCHPPILTFFALTFKLNLYLCPSMC